MKAYITIIFLNIFFQSHAQMVYIRAGKVFDGNQILNDLVIAISNGLIEGIFESTKAIPDSYRIIDASDCTILPGLIDSHIHFMGAPMPYVTEIEKHSWGKLASEGISLFPEHRLNLLMNGITSIIDMGAPLKNYHNMEQVLEISLIFYVRPV
jgi:imidazolonepropionase-like amidohydrolase